MAAIILQTVNVSKTFSDPMPVQVLHEINLTIVRGEFVSIVGKSGCGKSTLLYILSTMDTSYEGDLLIDNESVKMKREKQLARIRNEKIGFVFQFHYLLNEFSVLENVMLPAMKLDQYSTSEIRLRAMKKLEMLDIGQLAPKMPNQLSGGEKQRVAIARAMINDPGIIMGDEPTGNLDKKNTEIVFDIFQRLSSEYKQTLLVVTHDPAFAAKTQRTIEMEDGKIINNRINLPVE